MAAVQRGATSMARCAHRFAGGGLVAWPRAPVTLPVRSRPAAGSSTVTRATSPVLRSLGILDRPRSCGTRSAGHCWEVPGAVLPVRWSNCWASGAFTCVC